MNLFDMHQKYADVLSLDAVEAHLRGGSVNGRATRPTPSESRAAV